ncbi:hypothetical protein, partial [Pseudoxanthomonas mexicana]
MAIAETRSLSSQQDSGLNRNPSQHDRNKKPRYSPFLAGIDRYKPRQIILQATDSTKTSKSSKGGAEHTPLM